MPRFFIVRRARSRSARRPCEGAAGVPHGGPGATLGEGPLFDRGGYIATAVATEPMRILFLRRAGLLDLCRRHPTVALSMLDALACRMRRFTEFVSDLAFRPVPERLARYLDALARSSGPGAELDLELTQAQLATRPISRSPIHE